MTFAEKLVFLMNLTSTSNKQLAEAVKVDPSLISLLRTARRNAPRNAAHTKAMANYFARKCEGNYQRIALSEAMGRRYLQAPISTEQLAVILLEWLTDGRNQVGQFLSTFERFTLDEPVEADASPLSTSGASEQRNSAYFGNEGKRSAVRAFIALLLSLKEPGTVLLSSDECFDWLFEEPEYASQLQESVMQLLKKGFRLCRIAAPILTTEQAFDSLTQLMPLYLTGQVESYCYPRLRDNVFRRTLIVLPGEAAIVSTSLCGQSFSRSTIFTRDRRLCNAFAGEYYDFQARCRPMMTTYSTVNGSEELSRCIMRFENDKGNRIQQSTTLSSITSPPELISLVTQTLPAQDAENVMSTMQQAQEMFCQSLSEYELIDIHCIATAEQVLSGAVPVACSYFHPSELSFYTPKAYIAHLKSILSYMKRFENYHAVLLPRGSQTHALMVKDGRQAILLRPEPPLSVFEISQQYIAEACREYLMQLIKTTYTPEMQRQNTISQLHHLISELEDRSKAE